MTLLLCFGTEVAAKTYKKPAQKPQIYQCTGDIVGTLWRVCFQKNIFCRCSQALAYMRRTRVREGSEVQYLLHERKTRYLQGVRSKQMDEDLLRNLGAEAEAEPTEDPDALQTLRQLMERAEALDEEIEQLERDVTQKKAQRRKLLELDMVELMDRAQVPKLTHAGVEYTLGEYLKASIPKDAPHAQDAYAWMEENGGGALLQRGVHARFGKEFGAEAESLAHYIRTHYQMAETDMELGVPWARLTSWVKDLRKQGKDLPLELLGVTLGRIVKTKRVDDD